MSILCGAHKTEMRVVPGKFFTAMIFLYKTCTGNPEIIRLGYLQPANTQWLGEDEKKQGWEQVIFKSEVMI